MDETEFGADGFHARKPAADRIEINLVGRSVVYWNNWSTIQVILIIFNEKSTGVTMQTWDWDWHQSPATRWKYDESLLSMYLLSFFLASLNPIIGVSTTPDVAQVLLPKIGFWILTSQRNWKYMWFRRRQIKHWWILGCWQALERLIRIMKRLNAFALYLGYKMMVLFYGISLTTINA